MIDTAQIMMAEGAKIALQQHSGVNDNMSRTHYHEYYEFYFLDSGERYNLLDNVIFKAKAGDFIIFPPLSMHRSYGDKDVPFSRIVLYFRPEMVQYQDLLEKISKSCAAYHPETHLLHQIRRHLFSLLEEQEKPGEFHNDRMQAMLNLLLCDVMQQTQVHLVHPTQNRILEVIRFIHMHYADELTLAQLAQQAALSEYYLCREFKKFTNRTIVQYIQETRIMNAQRLFMETDQNVSQVSEKCGFQNLTHFNRVFRQIAGTTPSGYRKYCRELHGN